VKTPVEQAASTESTNISTPPTKRPMVRDLVIRHQSFESALCRLEECYMHALAGDPLCEACFAPSGSGKSQLGLYFARKHRRQEGPDGAIIPALYICLFPGVTVKQAAEQILHELGDPLYMRGSAFQKTARIYYFFQRCQVRVLIIDETNHFVDNRMNIAHEAADWLKDLINRTKVSVVLLGIERSVEVLNQNEQLRRKFGAPFKVGHFDWDEKIPGFTYRGLVRGFQECDTAIQLTILDNQDLAYRLYCASYGLIGYTAKYIAAAIRVAERIKAIKLDLKHFETGYSESAFSEGPPQANPFDPKIDPTPLAPLESRGRKASSKVKAAKS
jgi:hypothetical protein